MAIHTFKDGTKIITGDDFARFFKQRDLYDVSCDFCIYNIETDSICESCSVKDIDRCCSCHLDPPCQYCVESNFEPSPYLLNYYHYKGGRKKWECIRGDKECLHKLAEIEKAGFNLSAETLGTGEISINVEDSEYDYEFEICHKKDFLVALKKIIMRFDVKTEALLGDQQ